jgi:predicted transglutaminase-like cysteine proteinase
MLNRFSTLLALAVTALLMVGLSAGPTLAGAHAPLGYQLMCLKHPEQCRGGGAASIAVTADVIDILKKVNAKVNRAIRPKHDRGADVWSASASSGDCEDYVLAKRAALIKAGLPSSALRIAYVKTRSGEGHAILVVKSSGKDYVLDNLTGVIKPLSQTGYRIVSMSTANPVRWS